ncbi:MAG TPA: YajQ family cyclic di-GMP-binding protein [Acidimicrobiales bacterium]
MGSFDVSSEIDRQEVRNAIDQTARELATRYDFKNTDTSVELGESTITLRSGSEDRLVAARQVTEEKLVRRKVSLKAVSWGEVAAAAGASVRQEATLVAGISSEKAKEINKAIKELGLKGIQSQTQGEQVRVTAKKRDALQEVIAALKEKDFGIPLQFGNFRD